MVSGKIEMRFRFQRQKSAGNSALTSSTAIIRAPDLLRPGKSNGRRVLRESVINLRQTNDSFGFRATATSWVMP